MIFIYLFFGLSFFFPQQIRLHEFAIFYVKIYKSLNQLELSKKDFYKFLYFK